MWDAQSEELNHRINPAPDDVRISFNDREIILNNAHVELDTSYNWTERPTTTVTIEGQIVKDKPAEISKDMVGKWGKATFFAKRRIISSPSIAELREAPSSPHVTPGIPYWGELIYQDESYWLKYDDGQNIRFGRGDSFIPEHSF